MRLASPVSHGVWTLAAVIIGALVVTWLWVGHYTRRERVSGSLVPQAGLIDLTAHAAGTITAVTVREGMHVHAGDRLVSLSGERVSVSLGETAAAISTQLRAERARLHVDLIDTQTSSDQQAVALRAQQALLQTQVRQLDAQLAIQRQQSHSAEALLEKIQPLRAKGYISEFQVQQQQSTALEAPREFFFNERSLIMLMLTPNECEMVTGGHIATGRNKEIGGLKSPKNAHPNMIKGPGYGGGRGYGGGDIGGYAGYGYGFFYGCGGGGGYGSYTPVYGYLSAPGIITFTLENGGTYTQPAAADHPDRDMNPLDFQCGAFAYSQGAIGCDNGGGNAMAIFPSAQTGFDAAETWIDNQNDSGYTDASNPQYSFATGSETLNDIVGILSPPQGGNDTVEMQNFIMDHSGLNGGDQWNSLSEAQKAGFLNAYANREGFNGPLDNH